MDQQKPPEFILDVFSDPRSVREVVKGILHTIFFNRFFPSLAPRTHEVLDVTLPYVNDNELETLIEQRAYALERQLDAERLGGGAGAGTADGGSGGRGQITVQFFERKRRKAWLTRGEEEVCWETWTIKVTVAEPRTDNERAKVRKAMEQTLFTTAMKIVTFVNTHKDHIPPITTQGGNPFPYKINLESKETSWVSRIRMY
ncbi:DUF1649-domain-containing protein [Trichoderma reesei RUT C-30]|uniref:Autophagy-related protein 101 n=2 Tax=Hypocrea jecorina TaxID=51453 RepID=A0A024SL07_HYPJR|nr:DUF1649-domain-containing protein [Trichoderma reesei RUT C-30]